jgi:DNA-directed RNA polymerase subunit RPC12/RpoP
MTTQPELFCQERVGNLLREVPMVVGRIVFAPDHVPGVRKMAFADMLRCHDCGRMFSRLECSEQITFEGRAIRCEKCGDMAMIRATNEHNRCKLHPLPDMLGQPPAVPGATSIAAADAIKPCADTLRARVLDYIRKQGKTGATDDEIQVALNMNGSTQRPRRIELFQQGKICMATEMRLTRAGRKANVWISL